MLMNEEMASWPSPGKPAEGTEIGAANVALPKDSLSVMDTVLTLIE